MSRYSLIGVVASVAAFNITSFGGAPDPRFEGIWKGVETLQVPATLAQVSGSPMQKQTVIAIGAQGGILAVVQGLYPGRYKVLTNWSSTRHEPSSGSRMAFTTFPNLIRGPLHRGQCELQLSADGNTLTEYGLAGLPGTPLPVFCEIKGIFHREAISSQSKIEPKRTR